MTLRTIEPSLRYRTAIAGGAAMALIAFAAVTFIMPKILILKKREPSDYIIVLYGHDENYQAGLSLLQNGMGKRMFVCLDLPDVSLRGEELQKDREFLRETAGALADEIDLCGSEDEDILAELQRLLVQEHARRLMLVVPEPQSRTQYMIATRRFPQFTWSVTPVHDSSFDVHWWRKRIWTKTYIDCIRDFLATVESQEQKSISIQVSSN